MPVEGVQQKPWERNSYQLISWWDMQRFSAEVFVSAARVMERIRIELQLPQSGDPAYDFGCRDQLEQQGKQNLTTLMESVRDMCKTIGLRITLHAIERCIFSIQAGVESSRVQLSRTVDEINMRMHDEMKTNLFMYIPPDRADNYNFPSKEWEQVIQRFPKTKGDIEECSKCFACDRYAAAIFHILLVAEFGVIEVSRLLGVAGDKPGWGALDRLQRIIIKPYKDRSLLEQQHSALLEHTMPLMMAIKDSWRHKISHVENRLVWLDSDFSPHVAQEIVFAARGFMRRLATDLPK